MPAIVFHGVNDIRVEEVEPPGAGSRRSGNSHHADDDLRKPICTLFAASPVKSGLIIGHEPAGVIDELGPGVTGARSECGD